MVTVPTSLLSWTQLGPVKYVWVLAQYADMVYSLWLWNRTEKEPDVAAPRLNVKSAAPATFQNGMVVQLWAATVMVPLQPEDEQVDGMREWEKAGDEQEADSRLLDHVGRAALGGPWNRYATPPPLVEHTTVATLPAGTLREFRLQVAVPVPTLPVTHDVAELYTKVVAPARAAL